MKFHLWRNSRLQQKCTQWCQRRQTFRCQFTWLKRRSPKFLRWAKLLHLNIKIETKKKQWQHLNSASGVRAAGNTTEKMHVHRMLRKILETFRTKCGNCRSKIHSASYRGCSKWAGDCPTTSNDRSASTSKMKQEEKRNETHGDRRRKSPHVAEHIQNHLCAWIRKVLKTFRD